MLLEVEVLPRRLAPFLVPRVGEAATFTVTLAVSPQVFCVQVHLH